MTTGTEADTHQVLALEDQRYDAMVAGDFDRFAQLCHPDLTYTHSSAVVDSLSSYLSKCREGYYVYHQVDHPVSAAAVYGDTALVFGQMLADITAGGVRKQLDTVCLAVWLRTGDGWRLLAYQPTARPVPA